MRVFLSLSLAAWIALATAFVFSATAQEDADEARQQADGLNRLGLSQWRDGHYQRAVESFTQAIALEPDWQDPYNHRALARVAAGDHEGALADAETALSLLASVPASLADWAALLDTRAYTHLKLGQYREALTDYDAVLATNLDTHAAFPLGRGLSLVGLDEDRRGLEDLKWGTLIAPAFPLDPQLQDLLAGTQEALASLMPPQQADAYEPDDSPAQAKPLILDGGLQSHSLHAGGDVDWVSFDLQAGQWLRLFTSSPTCDTYLALSASDQQTVLWEDDDGGPYRASMLEYVARVSGTHYAAVRHFFVSQGTCASYELGGTVTPTR